MKLMTTMIIISLFILQFMVVGAYGIKVRIYSGHSMCPTFGKYEFQVSKRLGNIDEIEVGEV